MEDILTRIRSRIRTEDLFRYWMMDNWNALYIDIVDGTNKYPWFYDKIEKYYEERQ